MQAELQYKKREKKIAPSGWEAFNQKALYEAYEKRASNIPYSQEVLHCLFAIRNSSPSMTKTVLMPCRYSPIHKFLRKLADCVFNLYLLVPRCSANA